MDIDKLVKELDRQTGKKQRLEDELSAMAQILYALSKQIATALKEIKDPTK